MKFKKLALFLVPAALSLVGCSDYDNGYNQKAIEYENDFIETFGKIDPHQDWSMAGVVTANIKLDDSESYKVSIYTAAPGSLNSFLAAKQTVSANGSMTFDFPKNLDKAYLKAIGSNGETVQGFYNIIDRKLEVIKKATRAIDGITRTKETATSNLYGFSEEYNWTPEYQNVLKGLGFLDGENAQRYNIPYYSGATKGIYDLYHISGIESTYTVGNGHTWTVEQLIPILGKDGVFEEQSTSQIAKDGDCDLLHWYDDLRPDKGVDLSLAAGGPVDVEFFYGATQRDNKFGYLYYEEGASFKDIISAPRYILLENAQPMNMVQYSGSFTNWNDMANDIIWASDMTNGKTQEQREELKAKTVTGTIIPLIYFNPTTGESSYTFPENTHIRFFEILDGASSAVYPQNYGGVTSYSIPKMNDFFSRKHFEGHGTAEDKATVRPEERFITYRWGDNIVMGMEDTGDDDENDLLFIVNGNFKEKEDIPVIVPETPVTEKPLNWVVACEDLGGSFDYDFNDLVFDLKFTINDDETKNLICTPLAAGGTLEANLYYADESDSRGEMHHLVNSAITDTDQPLNADAGSTPSAGTPITLATNLAASTSINDVIGNIKIKITDGPKTNHFIQKYSYDGSTAPQMILLPGGWDWPSENTPITSIYSAFRTWVENADATAWCNKKTSSSNWVHNPCPKVTVENPSSGSDEPLDPDKTYYTITVSSDNVSYGTVSGGGVYEAGSNVIITATAMDGYEFVSWNDGNTNASREISVTEDASYTATFKVQIKQFTAIISSNAETLSFNAWGGGDIDVYVKHVTVPVGTTIDNANYVLNYDADANQQVHFLKKDGESITAVTAGVTNGTVFTYSQMQDLVAGKWYLTKGYNYSLDGLASFTTLELTFTKQQQ